MKSPTFPQYDTLTGRALLPLLLGEHITHRDFQNKTASYRLSSPIEVLRNDMHWPISDVWLEGLTNDKTGRRAKYKRYFISPEDLKGLRTQLGERLDKFIEAVKRFEAEAATPAHKAVRAGKGYEQSKP
jgi:hypothetical protein